MKQGQLYRYNREGLTPRFCEVKHDGLIKDDRDWSQRSVIAKGDVVMFIERLAYTEKTSGAAPALPAAFFAAAAAAAVAVDAAAGADAYRVHQTDADWKEVKDLWKQNKSIPGAVYLHPNGKLIWISDIDFKYFERI